MTNYELCKYYLDKNESINDCSSVFSEQFCISESLNLLDDMINKMDSGEIELVASARFDESYRSIDILYRNHVIDRDDFEELSLKLLDQIIKDIQKYIEYKDEQMKEGE